MATDLDSGGYLYEELLAEVDTSVSTSIAQLRVARLDQQPIAQRLRLKLAQLATPVDDVAV